MRAGIGRLVEAERNSRRLALDDSDLDLYFCFRHLSAFFITLSGLHSLMSIRSSSQRVLSLLNTYSSSHTQAACSTRSFVTCLHSNGPQRRTASDAPLNLVWTARKVRLSSCMFVPLSHCVKQRCFHASAVQSAPKDPYAVLGVKKDAAPADIKKTYFSVCPIFIPLRSHGIKARLVSAQVSPGHKSRQECKGEIC